MKKLFLVLFLLPGLAKANWYGSLDLSPTVQPLILREAHDGKWLAGSAHYLWLLHHNRNTIAHFGLFNAYNAQNGNGSFGPLIGLDLMGLSKDIVIDIPDTIANFGEWLGLPSIFKPVSLFTEILSIDAFTGYRPVHTSDVDGKFIYGGAAALKIPFGAQELKHGL